MKRVLAFVVVLAMLFPALALAAQEFHGLSITPAIEQISLTAGQTSANYQIRLDNNEPSPVTLQASSLDFKSLNNTGGLAFIANNASQLEHKYGLASYISLPSQLIVLPANGGQFVTVTINNLDSLSPGGHYAAVLFKVILPSDLPGSNNVKTDQIISSLVFVRKNGGAIYNLDLARATLHRSFAWFGWPIRLDALFHNSGNIQTAPIGLVDLKGQHSQLNINSSLILPTANRLISADLSSIKKPFWPGRYQASINYRPDEGGSAKSYRTSFVYIGWPFSIVLLAFIAASLVFFKRLRRLLWSWLRVSVAWLAPLGWRLLRSFKHLYFGARWLTKTGLRLVWKSLVHIDTVLGRWLDARDRRKTRRK